MSIHYPLLLNLYFLFYAFKFTRVQQREARARSSAQDLFEALRLVGKFRPFAYPTKDKRSPQLGVCQQK
jgi:hypothetical protein